MHLPALIEFLSGLEQNNNRPWFAWNKPAYDVLREEFEALVADVIARTARFDRGLGEVNARKAMFRIYRDTRFRKDKTPYKTHFSAAIRDRAKKGLEPGYYFEIDYRGRLGVGGGIYRPEPETLKRIRQHIADKPASLSAVLRHPRFAKTYGGLMSEDALARAPKGFAADLRHIDAIKQRHYFGFVEVDWKRKAPKDLAQALARYFEDVMPLIVWLRRAGAPAPSASTPKPRPARARHADAR